MEERPERIDSLTPCGDSVPRQQTEPSRFEALCLSLASMHTLVCQYHKLINCSAACPFQAPGGLRKKNCNIRTVNIDYL